MDELVTGSLQPDNWLLSQLWSTMLVQLNGYQVRQIIATCCVWKIPVCENNVATIHNRPMPYSRAVMALNGRAHSDTIWLQGLMSLVHPGLQTCLCFPAGRWTCSTSLLNEVDDVYHIETQSVFLSVSVLCFSLIHNIWTKVYLELQ